MNTKHQAHIDQCLEIIQLTNDGDALAPEHLYLVQTAVNGWLSEFGEVELQKLYQQVTTGTYVKPWLCGVEHLTRDHEGYVYWKGQHVEHYSFDDAAAELAAAQELAARCRWLEARGIEVNVTSAVWQWDLGRTEHRLATAA